ncbi:MAG: hypothetical protein IJI47_00930 [Eubacterium sp.]|nr:hypothetical protein [Eubacterium sp.]
MTNKRRKFRNIIMILMIVAFAAATCLTFTAANGGFGMQSQGAPQFSTNGQPPQMPGGDSQNSDSNNQSSESSSSNNSSNSDSQSSNSTDSNNQNSNSNGQPPEMPSGDNQNGNSNGQPPEKPDGDSNSNSGNQPPEMPSGDSNSTNSDSNSNSNNSNSNSDNNSNSDSSNQPPSMPGSDGNSSAQQGAPDVSKGKSKSAIYYVAFAVESLGIAALALYLIMSHMNKLGARETLKGGKRIAVFVLATIVIASGLTFAEISASGSRSSFPQQMGQMQQGGMPGGNNSSSAENVEANGASTVDGKEQTLADSYTSTSADESPILVTNGGNATITGTVNKKSGDSSNTENSEFYGVNSGVLVQAGSTATIEGATISTSAGGANAVFSTGENSKIYVKNTTIKTTGERSSRGLDATYGGYIEADNVNITTQGGSCATLATDRGEGTVIANNSTLETNGTGSPVIYSTGDISIDNTKGTANGSQNVVIEGKNSATVTNSTLTASGAGNRGDVDQAGVMIYQSMSGDASEGTGTFTAKNSSLSIQSSSDYYKTAPMFFITNTDAKINLTNTKLAFGSGTLISAKGTSEWGNSGSNGGNVTLNATSQTLKGNIEVDNISTASITLTKSTYEGTINGDNTAKEITLKLDKDSKITLTGDSYVTSLENADTTNSNIDFNGHTLYVNGKAVNG